MALDATDGTSLGRATRFCVAATNRRDTLDRLGALAAILDPPRAGGRQRAANRRHPSDPFHAMSTQENRTPLGRSESKTLEANEVILLDQKGKKRVVLSAVGGGPRLVLLNEDEEPRASLGVMGGEPARVGLNLRRDEPELGLFDADGEPLYVAP